MKNSPKICGIIIWTENLKEMTDFYEKILGLSVKTKKPNYVNFEWGDFKLTIGEHSQVKGKSKDKFRIMINFDVLNINQTISDLSKKGINIIRKPEREEWGGLISTIEDPDKNIIQFLQKSS
ncbi:MAG: hypothetical protein CL764_06815 [Chloroflexi bacterium]|nr:hypothetical protein [Chloroflexota bacterium]|tara:strand:+ start:81 stop:446 length:366 start_codon:yes stop_codon:yes gene_type:complete